jgi:hypothetical protein
MAVALGEQVVVAGIEARDARVYAGPVLSLR